MATSEILAIRGDTIEGAVNLREINACDEEKEDTYAIPSGATVEMRFPGESATVSLTSGASEVTIVDAAKGSLTFKISPAKSALLKVGSKQTITLHVSYNAGADRKTFQKKSIFTVADRAND